MEPRDLLQALMTRAGHNPNSLAEAIHDPSKQGQIWRFLNGQTKEPRGETLRPLASFFHIPVEALRNPTVAAQVAEERGLKPGERPSEENRQAPMKHQSAELAAIQVTLLALINTHQDKGALLAAFDGIVAGIRHASEAGGEGTSEAFRVALQRFRDQIARQHG